VKRDVLEHPDVGFALLARHWSKGYAFEAAAETVAHARGTLKLPYLHAAASPANLRSLRLLERLGFRYLRTLQFPGFSAESQLFGMELGVSAGA
jgi:RimJ/RimL family protein N-acetyltransferase